MENTLFTCRHACPHGLALQDMQLQERKRSAHAMAARLVRLAQKISREALTHAEAATLLDEEATQLEHQAQEMD